jgi:hypothetical protein
MERITLVVTVLGVAALIALLAVLFDLHYDERAPDFALTEMQPRGTGGLIVPLIRDVGWR